jgi:hypothetical protein
MWTYSTTKNWLKQKHTNYYQEVNWCHGTLHKRSNLNVVTSSLLTACHTYHVAKYAMFTDQIPCPHFVRVGWNAYAKINKMWLRHRRYLPSPPGHCNYVLAHALLTDFWRMFSLSQCVWIQPIDNLLQSVIKSLSYKLNYINWCESYSFYNIWGPHGGKHED